MLSCDHVGLFLHPLTFHRCASRLIGKYESVSISVVAQRIKGELLIFLDFLT